MSASLPEVVDAIHGLWDGLPLHAGRAAVCMEDGPQFADPRCWGCLAWLAEDPEPVEAPSFKGSKLPVIIEGEDRKDLIAHLRRSLAYA